MDVHIDQVTSTVRAVDGSALLSPQVMQQIIRIVLQAVEQETSHQRRARAERRVTPGVTYEMEEEER
jgi:hypothetical protein